MAAPERQWGAGGSSFRRQPQDHVANAVAWTAHRLQPIENARLKPDLTFALGFGFSFGAHKIRAADGRGDGLEGGWGDGDADHAPDDTGRGGLWPRALSESYSDVI
jgi:hypothetical protein